MKTKVIRNTWMVRNGYRLDTNPYLGGAIETKLLLENLPLTKEFVRDLIIPDFGGVYFAGRESSQWVDSPRYGVPCISGGDLQKADLSDTSFISKRQVEANPAFLIRKGMTLITRSGSIGRTAYARADMDGMATSDPLRVVPDSNKIPPGYLYAFLSSKFGVPLIASGASGAVIKHLDPADILDIPIPRLGDTLEHEIHDLVEEAGQSLTEHGELFRQATSETLQLANIQDLPRHNWIKDERRIGWSQPAVRTDSLRALNYDRRVADHFAGIRAAKHSQLGELCEPKYFVATIVFSRIDCDEEHGVKLVGQREAFQIWPDGRTIARSSIEGLGLLVKPGTTLIPSHGTFGEFELFCRAVYATKRTSAYAFGGDFYRCVPRPGSIPPGYLFAFLRSEVAFRMLRSISAGSKQQYQHRSLMYELPIPRLNDAEEKRIAALIDRAADQFDHALDCEEKARTILEEAISNAK